MQREEPEGIIISCDFCRRDWDGQEAMIEGHHGSILCLQCMQRALKEQQVGTEKYKCTLCLRFNIPGALPAWRNSAGVESSVGGASDAIVCQECLYQAAKAFSRNPDVEFTFNAAEYPPLAKVRVETVAEE